MARRTRLEVTSLEDRITPIAGGYDTVPVADAAGPLGTSTLNLSGIVDYASGGTINYTGALLDRGGAVVGSRHILTNASNVPAIGTVMNFQLRLPDGNLKQISIPIQSVALNAANDLAVLTLSAVAPFGASSYPIYTSAQAATVSEVGKPFIQASYFANGTATSGINSTSELQRMTITATGGSFRLYRSDNMTTSTAIIPGNGTPAQIIAQTQLAMTQLGFPGSTVRQVASGPFTGSYEILFGGFGSVNAPRLQFVSNTTTPDPLVNGGFPGTVAFTTMINGLDYVEYQRLSVTATGGTFTLAYNGTVTAALPSNATPAQVQSALENAGTGEVTVRLTAAGVYQIAFDTIPTDVALLTLNTTALVGTAKVITLIDGGKPPLLIGQNVYDATVAPDQLMIDFDNNGTDTFGRSIGFYDTTGTGNYAITSVGDSPAASFVYGSTENDVRVSTHTAFIQGITNTPNYTLNFDMQYQLAGADGVADTIRIAQTAGRFEIYVTTILPGELVPTEHLYYADLATNISSVVIRGTSDNDTVVVGAGVTKAIRVDGISGTDALVGPNASTVYSFNGADTGIGTTPTNAITFLNVQTVAGGSAADTFSFTAAGSFSGTIDGGAGADTLDLSNGASATVVLTSMGPTADGVMGTAAGSALTGTFQNMNAIVGSAAGTTDSLTGTNAAAVFTQTGTNGTYADVATGLAAAYSNFESLTGGAGNDTFNLRSTAAAFAVAGGAGNDTFNLTADAPANAAGFGSYAGAVVLDGGAGSDQLVTKGTGGNDAVALTLTAATGAGTLAGLPQGITFSTLEGMSYDGGSGANAFTVLDQSNTVFGSAANPASGIVYRPAGVSSGAVSLGSVFQVSLASITAGLNVNGDADGSGDRDTLLVLGTSAAGLQSAFGELVLGDGRDQITVTDTGVTLAGPTGGPLLSVGVGYTNGAASFNTLYVATGNERPTLGDIVTVTPSVRLNLVVDAGRPSAAVRPGDRVSIQAGGTTSAVVNDPAVGPPQTRVTQSSDGASVGLIGFESGAPQTVGTGMIAVGADAGPVSTVRVFDRLSGALRYTVTPFDGFTAGVKVASGDVNGDGIADLVVGAGPGGGPRVGVFNGLDGSLIADFFGYDESFRGGVNVAVGDINGDGYADIVLGTGDGGGPRVRVLNGFDLTVNRTLVTLRDAFAYAPSFRGGVNVAVGDVNGDGTPDVVTSTGSGGGPQVVVFDGQSFRPIASFFVFDPASRDGFFVGIGDVNGDGFADIIAGSGAGGPARVRVFSGQNRALLTDFFLNDPFDPAAGPAFPTDVGVRVAAADVNGDGIDDVVTARGPNSLPVVRAYQILAVNPQTNALFPTLQEIRNQNVFDDGFGFGIFVGASN